jgi:hypothetical protein
MTAPVIQAEPRREAADLDARVSGRMRLAARIASDYLLKTLILLKGLHGGDLLRAVIFQAIAAANTAHLDHERARPDSAVDSIPADDARRPVSMLAIANGLGVPFETVRRHINAMIADGICERVTGGVIIPRAVFTAERASEVTAANYQNLTRLFRDLRAAGIEL